MRRIEWQAENERLLEKLGGRARSYAGWKAVGRYVKRGEKQKRFTVQSGTRSEMDPLTGEMRAEPIFKTAYGFTEDQTAKAGRAIGPNAIALPSWATRRR